MSYNEHKRLTIVMSWSKGNLPPSRIRHYWRLLESILAFEEIEKKEQDRGPHYDWRTNIRTSRCYDEKHRYLTQTWNNLSLTTANSTIKSTCDNKSTVFSYEPRIEGQKKKKSERFSFLSVLVTTVDRRKHQGDWEMNKLTGSCSQARFCCLDTVI